jgi:hypothetical protein
MSEVAREAFIDSDGNERTPNQWGFNSFRTAEGAKDSVRTLSVRTLSGKGTEWFIWRLADGTFDFTATGKPDVPGHPSELVERVMITEQGRLAPAPVSAHSNPAGTSAASATP